MGRRCSPCNHSPECKLCVGGHAGRVSECSRPWEPASGCLMGPLYLGPGPILGLGVGRERDARDVFPVGLVFELRSEVHWVCTSAACVKALG